MAHPDKPQPQVDQETGKPDEEKQGEATGEGKIQEELEVREVLQKAIESVLERGHVCNMLEESKLSESSKHIYLDARRREKAWCAVM